jgi:hypothetical protein
MESGKEGTSQAFTRSLEFLNQNWKIEEQYQVLVPDNAKVGTNFADSCGCSVGIVRLQTKDHWV